MIRMQCVLCQEGTEVVLMIQMNFISQRATFGCKIVSSLKKRAIRIFGTQEERKVVRIPLGEKYCFLFQSLQNRSGAKPASCSMGTLVLSWGKSVVA